MPRYIDADRLIKGIRFAVCTTCAFDYNKEKCRCDTGDCITYIEDCPTADVQETKHGRWIECDYKRLEHGMIETYPKAGYACSVCRVGFEKKKMTYKQHCPHCGAIMDGDAE